MKKLILIILISTLTSCSGYNFYEMLASLGAESPNLARSISFTDESYLPDDITGTLTFLPALSENNITEYRLYLGVDASTKHTGAGLIQTFTPNGGIQTTSPLNFTNFNITGATHFLIYSVKGTDEMSVCASLKIHDLVVEQFADINTNPPPPPTSDSNPTGFIKMDGLLYFGANDGIGYAELWSTDGIDGSSVHTKKVFPGLGITMSGVWKNNLIKSGNLIFFSASQGASGNELWYYDTTLPVSGGNPVCLAILPVGTGSNPSQPVVINGKLYFSATESGDTELFEYDPAGAGTLTKIDIYGGVTSSNPSNLTAYNNKLYFSANHGSFGIELWELDPYNIIFDIAGVYNNVTNPKVIDIIAGGTPSNPSNLIVYNNKLYFSATHATNGNELWELTSDVTYSVGTNPKLLDLYPGGSSFPQGLTIFNDKLVFSATDPLHGREAWLSDGTLSGTYMINDQTSGVGGSIIALPFVFNNKVYTNINLGVTTTQLGVTDGTSSGTEQIVINSGGNADPQYFTSLNGLVYFVADDGTVNGIQIWSTDGTSSGTIKRTDIAGLAPKELFSYNGKIFFQGTDAANGTELWVLYYK